jgi:hypothetical protein
VQDGIDAPSPCSHSSPYPRSWFCSLAPEGLRFRLLIGSVRVRRAYRISLCKISVSSPVSSRLAALQLQGILDSELWSSDGGYSRSTQISLRDNGNEGDIGEDDDFAQSSRPKGFDKCDKAARLWEGSMGMKLLGSIRFQDRRNNNFLEHNSNLDGNVSGL